MLRIWRALHNSIAGLRRGAREETAIREEVIALIFGMPLALVIGQDAMMRIALISALLLVLTVETLNTAIERLCDHITADRHDTIGYVKDLGSAAVLGSLLIAAMVWGLAFWRFVWG